MKSTEKIKLTKGEWFNHFEISMYLLIPVVMLGYIAIIDSHGYESLILILIFIGASIFFYWLNWSRLFFQEFKGEMTDEQFKRATIATAKELDWEITKLEGSYAQVFRFSEVLENGEERITIKKTKDKLFINSMKNPVFAKIGYSSKRNKENVSSFLVNAANILKGKNVEEIIFEKQEEEEEAFWEESEWTIGKILKRIIVYGITIIFLFIGVVGIFDGDWWILFAVVTALRISLSFIKSDIEIILEKKRRKKIIEKEKGF